VRRRSGSPSAIRKTTSTTNSNCSNDLLLEKWLNLTGVKLATSLSPLWAAHTKGPTPTLDSYSVRECAGMATRRH
jgi:hypothetical protein